MATRSCSAYVIDSQSGGTFYCPGPSLCRNRIRGVYGGGPSTPNAYSGDSSICRAAVHAGMLAPDAEGAFMVIPIGARDSLDGSLENGVQSYRWQGYDHCFMVIPSSAPPPSAATTTASSSSNASAFRTHNSEATRILPCASYVHDSCTGVYRCSGLMCAAKTKYGNDAVYGILPGSGDLVFTGDSVPCRAAKFVGIISAETGGVFQLKPCGARDAFAGSAQEQNGVSIRSWSKPYQDCFRVEPYVMDSALNELLPMKRREEVKAVIRKEEYD